jgi:hypothetical protein
LMDFWVRLEFPMLQEQMWGNTILLLFCAQILAPSWFDLGNMSHCNQNYLCSIESNTS